MAEKRLSRGTARIEENEFTLPISVLTNGMLITLVYVSDENQFVTLLINLTQSLFSNFAQLFFRKLHGE